MTTRIGAKWTRRTSPVLRYSPMWISHRSRLTRWVMLLSSILVMPQLAHAREADLAQKGADTAKALTLAYKRVTPCAAYLAAPWCSGVLVKDVVNGDPSKEGNVVYLNQALSRHSLQFSIQGEATHSGFAFTLPPTAPASAGRFSPYCALPYLTDAGQRGAHGCRQNSGKEHITDTDPASCADLGIKTANQWKDQYQKAGNPQCSFSTTVATQFEQAIAVNNLGLKPLPLEILMPQWQPTDLSSIWHGAWIYEMGSRLGRERAIKNKQFAAHGLAVPVLEFDGDRGEFRYHESDNTALKPPATEDTPEQKLRKRFLQNAEKVKIYFPTEAQLAGEQVILPREHLLFANYQEHLTLYFHPDGSVHLDDRLPGLDRHPYYGLIYLPPEEEVAIFYIANTETGRLRGLKSALKIQTAYKPKGRELPVVHFKKIPRGPGHHTTKHGNYEIIWYDQTHDPYARWRRIVEKLNERYAKTVSNCAEQPAHYCSGVIMHASTGSQFGPWDYPPGRHSSGISYSYARADIKDFSLYHSQGMILMSTEEQERTSRKVEIACMYPWDADTNSGAYSTNTALCTSEAYKKHPEYFRQHINSFDKSSCQDSVPFSKEVDTRHTSMIAATGHMLSEVWKKSQSTLGYARCSFSARKANEFYAAILTTNSPGRPTYWNEMMITSYPKDTGADILKLPIEAFFFFKNNNDAKILAHRYQDMYSQKTGVSGADLPPVVSVDFRSEHPFSPD